MAREDLKRFEKLTYDDFRRMARDDSLSPHEKIGFPDSYREGKEERIFDDIVAKLPQLTQSARRVVDIGPGCSGLPHMLIDLCRRMGSELVLVDSPEMLDKLPSDDGIRKLEGRFPEEVSLAECAENVDAVIVYSVLHYIVQDGREWAFLEQALSLLASGGAMLLGDIPNWSKRRRFFTSEAGVAFHRAFIGDNSLPNLDRPDDAAIDDGVILEIVRRSRERGFDAYVLPQPSDLPMANRREDILIVRP